MTEITTVVTGYEVEIEMELHLVATDEDEDDCYERVRVALSQYEDALAPPLCVTLTRRAPSPLPEDELECVLSVCRDAVVDVLGIAANHPGVAWQSNQLLGPAALIVEVRPTAPS